MMEQNLKMIKDIVLRRLTIAASDLHNGLFNGVWQIWQCRNLIDAVFNNGDANARKKDYLYKRYFAEPEDRESVKEQVQALLRFDEKIIADFLRKTKDIKTDDVTIQELVNRPDTLGIAWHELLAQEEG